MYTMHNTIKETSQKVEKKNPRRPPVELIWTLLPLNPIFSAEHQVHLRQTPTREDIVVGMNHPGVQCSLPRELIAEIESGDGEEEDEEELFRTTVAFTVGVASRF